MSDNAMLPFWISTHGGELAQGDYLSDCLLPLIPDTFGPSSKSTDLSIQVFDLIIVTQSCDLANAKIGLAALCPINSLESFETLNPNFARKGAWEEVRKGCREGLHLLASPINPINNRESLVVNFRQIFSLPIAYLRSHAVSSDQRWRLQSPFLEHFSQAFAFARFFMRVGLPSAIPAFTE